MLAMLMAFSNTSTLKSCDEREGAVPCVKSGKFVSAVGSRPCVSGDAETTFEWESCV